jgi:hypothetical protein
MTASQRVEMWATRRDPSYLPVRAAELPRAAWPQPAAIILARTTRTTATPSAVALIAASLIAGDTVLAVALGLAEAPWRWQRRDLAVDVTHKTSLAVAARAIASRRHDR